jgi:hypothetical protein
MLPSGLFLVGVAAYWRLVKVAWIILAVTVGVIFDKGSTHLRRGGGYRHSSWRAL